MLRPALRDARDHRQVVVRRQLRDDVAVSGEAPVILAAQVGDE